MTVIRKARSSGTGLRLTIPKIITDMLEIVDGTELEIKLENNVIMVAPAQTAKSELTQADTPAKRHLHESYI